MHVISVRKRKSMRNKKKLPKFSGISFRVSNSSQTKISENTTEWKRNFFIEFLAEILLKLQKQKEKH